MAPTPEAVADAMEAAALGADLDRLAVVCLDRADQHEGVGKQRLLDAAATMTWTTRFLAILNGPNTTWAVFDLVAVGTGVGNADSRSVGQAQRTAAP